MGGDWKRKSKCEKEPSHPHNCYSKDWKKEIMHGEVGPHKCCWYGDWKRKSKCEKKPSHPHNCYSKDWKKEIMHGRWVPTSAAGTVTGSASLSAMVVTRMIELFCFCDYLPLAQAPPFHFFHLITTKSRSKCTLCKITM